MPTEKTYAEIVVGDTASFEVLVDEALILSFAQVSGDKNPLHVEDGVAHGMLGGALFSRLVGMYLPGQHSLYLSQTLLFKKTITAGMKVRVSGTVIQKVDAASVITMTTTIKDADDIICTTGEAMVKVLV